MDDASTVTIAAATHVGHVRGRNEDHAVVDGHLVTGDHARRLDEVTLPAMVAVLDGMGGHPAGDVASRLVASLLVEGDVPTSEADLGPILESAQVRMTDHMAVHPETATMGTTLVTASVLAPDRALVASVGDSSAWWYHDETLVDLLPRDRGPFGGITQVVGGTTTDGPLTPHVSWVTGPGRLLLCTDGLADVVDPDAVARILVDIRDPGAVVDALVDLALQEGGPDNVTIVLVDLDGREAAR